MYYLREGYWSVYTLLFYTFIIFVTLFLMLYFRKEIRINKTISFDFGITMVFFLLLFVLGFRTTGRDINGGYYANFLSSDSISMYRDQSVEIGFIILNVIVKRLFNNYSVFIFLIALATILPVFWFVNKNVTKKDAPYVLTFYVSTYYFSGFSAARQYLAVSLCLIVYDMLKERKHLKALLWILIAASIHTSSLVMFIPFFLTVNKLMNKRMIWFSVLIMFCAVFFLRHSINGMLGARYNIYTAFSSVQIGTRWIAYYLPIIYLLFREVRNEKNKYLSKLNISVVAVGFLFEMLSYVVSIMGRLGALTIPFIYIIPYYISMETSKKKKTVYRIMLLFYCGLRFWLYINDHYQNESLMPYTNIFFNLR